MKQKLLACFCLSLFLVLSAWAQEKPVSGVVTDADTGEPLPGVNVIVKGTNNGTVTDVNGKYNLNVAEGATLVFRAVGMGEREVLVGASSVVDVKLLSSTKELTEVVVTAIGIEKEKKALGYAISQVGKEQIEERSEGDIGRLLRGKASGVQVTQTNGVSGSGTNIIIRGYTSITGDNQPLFIVDGVPFNGSSNQQSNFVDGQTESSRFLDLDPNNIENVTVLKGLSATVLYGDRGRNGVILITTKNSVKSPARRKTEVTLSQSFFANRIASLPDYQKNYGGGFHQNFGFFFSNWGPHFDEIDVVDHPYSRFNSAARRAAFPEFQDAPYLYQNYNSVQNFFNTGFVSNTSLNVRGSTDRASYSVSYSYLDDTGFTPNNELVRHNIGVGGSAILTNNITVNATFNYTNTDYTTPPIAASQGSGSTGDGASVFGDVFYTPRSVDLMSLPFTNPLDGSSVYYRSGNDIQNPRWTAENAFSSQVVDRFYGQASISYQLKDFLNFMYRIGIDSYTENNEYGQNRGGVDGNINGIYRTSTAINRIINHDYILTFNKYLTEDIGLNVIAGFNARRDIFTRQGVESTNQLIFDVFEHFAFINQANTNSFSGASLDTDQAVNRLGIFGNIEVSFKNYLFLTLSARNDWSNTLESGNNSLFYPAASLAFDVTSAVPALQNNPILSYLKLRVGYGSSANFPPPFQTQSNLFLTTRAFTRAGESDPIPAIATGNRLGNADLQPERLSEIEVGVESRFWNNRIGLDISLYSKTTTDLILDRGLDPSTGFRSLTTNAGELRVQGIEIDVNALILDISGFKFNISGNFTAYENEIIDLPDDVDQIQIAGFTNRGTFAIEGQPFGVIQGPTIQLDDEGRRLVNANGDYVVDPDISIIGDPNPEWNSTLTTTLSWKGLSFTMEWQYQQGGDIFSIFGSAVVGRGLTTDTDFDRRQTFVLPGVLEDGAENNIQLTATRLWFNNLGFGADELRVFDATHLRLNEVSLSYALPSSLLDKTPFGSVVFTASGFNLWYEAFNFPKGTNFDPNSNGTGVGNGLGLDFLNGPTSRRFGGSVKVTF
ncbi:MAG: SusC/RagA family TonB-linked outer membrane protein [Bacteroidota bacterium]